MAMAEHTPAERTSGSLGRAGPSARDGRERPTEAGTASCPSRRGGSSDQARSAERANKRLLGDVKGPSQRLELTMTFCGLMSAWRTFISCAQRTAPVTCLAQLNQHALSRRSGYARAKEST